MLQTAQRSSFRTARSVVTVVSAGLVLLALLCPHSVTGQETEPESHYGETPEELVPFRGAGEPYSIFFTEPPQFRGPGREVPEPANPEEVPIGVLVPYEGIDRELGRRMRNGVELAIEEANRDGGFRGGVPFVPVYRDESQAWGASANAAVELVYDEGVWGLVGALEDNASHVISRVLLKIEVPVVNTNGSDPTLTEHMVPWMLRVRPDDRRNGYRLAQKIFTEDRRERVAVFRANDRYARMGITEFADAARRLRRPIELEVRFQNHDTSWDAQIERLRSTDPDAIVLWGRAEQTGRVLAAMRAAGLNQPVYGPDRLYDALFLAAAGDAANGAVVTHPFDPNSAQTRWLAFRETFRSAYGEDPDATAAYAYDGTRYLLQAIETAGLNRVRIRDELFSSKTFEGVTGTMRFDTNHNNVSPVVLCRVRNGKFELENSSGDSGIESAR